MQPVYAWIKTNTNKNDIISSTGADMVYLHTNRPGIYSPNNLNKENYSKYVNHYHVQYFLVVGNNAFYDQTAIVKAKFSDSNSKIYAVR